MYNEFFIKCDGKYYKSHRMTDMGVRFKFTPNRWDAKAYKRVTSAYQMANEIRILSNKQCEVEVVNVI